MRLVRYTYPGYRFVPASPFASPLSRLQGEIDSLFGSAFGESSDQPADRRVPIDYREDETNVYVRAELPGVSRDEIQLEVTEDALTIAGASKAAAKPAGENAENGQAAPAWSFNRAVSLPEGVQADKASATYENGILTVTLPKREAVKPRKVAIA